jgi:hypothetical protein
VVFCRVCTLAYRDQSLRCALAFVGESQALRPEKQLKPLGSGRLGHGRYSVVDAGARGYTPSV